MCIVNVNDLSSKYNFVYIIENNIVIFDRTRSVLFFFFFFFFNENGEISIMSKKYFNHCSLFTRFDFMMNCLEYPENISRL